MTFFSYYADLETNSKRTMSKKLFLAGFSLAGAMFLLWTLVGPSSNHILPDGVAEQTTPVQLASLGGLPIRIIENRGQAPADVLFHASTAHHNVLFSAEAVSFGRTLDDATEQIVMRFLDSNPAPTVEGTGRGSSRTNMYLGNDPSEWLIDIPTYSSLIYRELYPGVDLTFEGHPDQLKSTFYVHPGSSPSQIRFSFEGADDVSVRHDGSLVVKTPFGELIDGAPVVYQIVDGRRNYIETRYDVSADGSVGFRVEHYHPDLTLVIDPDIVYATYIGGSNVNVVVGADMDARGHIYVAGYVRVPDFPGVDVITVGGAGTSSDLFVAKIDTAKGVYVWLTLFGSANDEIASGFKLDGVGNSYVTGYGQGEGFPLMKEVQSVYGGGPSDVVAAIIDSGGALQFGTYLGGSAEDRARSIDIGPGGELVIGGWTTSLDFPTRNALQPDNAGMRDAFVSVIPREGGTVAFSSYFGGSDDDAAETVWVRDDEDNERLWLGGQTKSPDFPLRDPNDDMMTGTGDGFFMRFTNLFPGNSATPELEFSSFLGGNGLTRIYDIEGNENGGACGVGSTSSDDLQTVNPLQPEPGGDRDGIFFCTDGQDNLLTQSYLGQDKNDVLFAVDATTNGCMIGVGGANAGEDALLYWFCPDGTGEEIDAKGLPGVHNVNVLDDEISVSSRSTAGRPYGNFIIAWTSSYLFDAPTDKAVQTEAPTQCHSCPNGGLAVFVGPLQHSTRLKISKTSSTTFAEIGDPVKWTITVTNIGDEDAFDVTVREDSRHFEAINPETGEVQSITGRNWHRPVLVEGGIWEFELEATLSSKTLFGESENIVWSAATNVHGMEFDEHSISTSPTFIQAYFAAFASPRNPFNHIQFSESDNGVLKEFRKTATTFDIYVDSLRVADNAELDFPFELEGVPVNSTRPVIEIVAANAPDNSNPLVSTVPNLLFVEGDSTVTFSDQNLLLISGDEDSLSAMVARTGFRSDALDSSLVDFFVTNFSDTAIDLLAEGGTGKSAALLIEDLHPDTLSAYLSLEPAQHTFEVLASGDGSRLGRFRVDWSATAGEAFTVVVSGTGDSTGVTILNAAGEATDVVIVGAPDEAPIPNSLTLHGNYPNPFRGETRIVFDLPDQASVHVEVYDLLGRRVSETAPKPMQGGLEQSIFLRIPDLPAGTYFYRVIAVGGSADMEAAGELVVTR